MTTLTETNDTIHSVTPILPVDAIEPSIPFWEAAGFVQDSAVPEAATTKYTDSKRIGFIIMKGPTADIMFQTYRSLEADNDVFTAATTGKRPTFLFVRVKNLEAIINALDTYPVTMEKRETFYGSTEIAYREPGGHMVTFAEFKEE